ncbi:MAG: putative toxin-antitoxin system toxin component, PIN family [Magnetococcales bacterium]|nr:putative toxin-antitoxin system toxin component, PIN family [Magnetococcales bacterium]
MDTNILVSFAICHNPAFERMFDWIAENGVLLVCDETISELMLVFAREKFRKYLSHKSVIDYVKWYADISESVVVTSNVSACRDSKDDKFLSLAVSGKADCIIAGDHDLLDMGEYQGIPIYSPSVFVARVGVC